MMDELARWNRLSGAWGWWDYLVPLSWVVLIYDPIRSGTGRDGAVVSNPNFLSKSRDGSRVELYGIRNRDMGVSSGGGGGMPCVYMVKDHAAWFLCRVSSVDLDVKTAG